MKLVELDQHIFKIINQEWSNPVFDLFFPFWTDIQKSAVFYVLMATVVFFFFIKKAWRPLSVIVLCSLGMYLSGLLNSKLIKPFFERVRPTETILRVAKETSFSFPSGHATTAFFMAMFISLFFPKLRFPLFVSAILTGYSRIYCGVHYPGDIMAGALLGSLLAFGFYLFWDNFMKRKLRFLSFFLTFLFSLSALAWEDPTNKKPFFPWVWEDQLKPTIVTGFDKTGLVIAGAATGSVLAVHQYDGKIFDFTERGGNLWMDESTAQQLGKLGNGMAGILVVGTQLAFDQQNGLKSSRALVLTTFSHITMAAVIQRNRPRNRQDFLPYPSSFPSGHTSSAFAVAGSLAYSYGWAGAIPGYLAATAIAVSRVKENRHWASDIVGGAFLGTFWARASFAVDDTDKEAFLVVPVPMFDGMMLSAVRAF